MLFCKGSKHRSAPMTKFEADFTAQAAPLGTIMDRSLPELAADIHNAQVWHDTFSLERL